MCTIDNQTDRPAAVVDCAGGPIKECGRKIAQYVVDARVYPPNGYGDGIRLLRETDITRVVNTKRRTELNGWKDRQLNEKRQRKVDSKRQLVDELMDKYLGYH